MGKNIVAVGIVVLMLGVAVLQLKLYGQDHLGIFTYDDLVGHLTDEAEGTPCKSTTVERCFSLADLKRDIGKREGPRTKEFFLHYLRAVRAFRRGDLQGAGAHYLQNAMLLREPFASLPPAGSEGGALLFSANPYEARGSFQTTEKEKLVHDIKQFEYLISRNILPESFGTEVQKYKDVLAALKKAMLKTPKDPHAKASRLSMTDPAYASVPFYTLAATYNRMVNFAKVGRIPTGAVNDALDAQAVQLDYYANQPGFTYLDNFLVPEAVEALRKLCLESTFWFDHKFGYVGAYMDEGFYSELLYQISDEVKSKFPHVFRGARMTGMWAYSYDSDRGSGIGLHADEGLVNVNFWITPDAANLDPNSGGLTVYLKQVPMEWSGPQANAGTQLLEEFVKSDDVKSVSVHYKQNRMVFFNSRMVHNTEKIRFRKGHLHRRINITMLFGNRATSDMAQPPAEFASDVAAHTASLASQTS